MKKIFFVSIAFLVCVDASVTLKQIDSKPSSRAKNFLIWQYLNQDITDIQADRAYSQVDGEHNKILYRYAKKTKNKKTKYEVSCKKAKDLTKIDDTKCLELAFNAKKTEELSNKQRIKLINNLKSSDFVSILKIQNDIKINEFYKKHTVETFLKLFNKSSFDYRYKNLNIDLDIEFVNSFSDTYNTSNFIKLAVNDENFNKLQKSLLDTNGKQLNSQSNFFLGLNQLNHFNTKKAIEHFYIARKKATTRIHRDKNDFWLYLSSLEEKYLKRLVRSNDINIYRLYASEIYKVDIDNYFSDVKTNPDKEIKNLKDPFVWAEILSQVKQTPKNQLIDLSKQYQHQEMMPVQNFILQKASNYVEHGFIMPYDSYMTELSVDDKALVYALMRQESQLIPSAISRSFALGLMQIMPFVTDDISKTIKNPINNYGEMFNPKTNIRYAIKHIRWMQKSLYHPLFIAYGYNGGVGFFKRYLKNDKFKNKKYEPFLSMEMMSNSESREYGKKVLSNYIMYKKILGEKVSIVHLFDTLLKPKLTDRFRKLN